MGATCFLNAAVRGLLHLRSVWKLLVDHAVAEGENAPMTQALVKLTRKLYGHEPRGDHDACSPLVLHLDDVYAALPSSFKDGHLQQDADETLRVIVDMISEEHAILGWNEVFSGLCVASWECPGCGNGNGEQLYLGGTLVVNLCQENSTAECFLRDLVARGTVVGGVATRTCAGCSKCKEQFLKMSFVQVPPVLIVMLSRGMKMDDSNLGIQQTKVIVDEELSLPVVGGTTVTYRVQAAVVHRGSESAQHGHYVAFGNIEQSPGVAAQWYEFDDSEVSPCGDTANFLNKVSDEDTTIFYLALVDGAPVRTAQPASGELEEGRADEPLIPGCISHREEQQGSAAPTQQTAQNIATSFQSKGLSFLRRGSDTASQREQEGVVRKSAEVRRGGSVRKFDRACVVLNHRGVNNNFSFDSWRRHIDGDWLSDESINGMSALIARSPGAHCTRVVVGTSHTLEKVKDASRTRSQVDVIMGYNEMREVSFGEMRKIQIITLPVNEPGSHWWLIVIYPLTQKIAFIDSALGVVGEERRQERTKAAGWYYELLWNEKKAASTKSFAEEYPSGWEVEEAKWPRQGDGSSCGVFTIMAMMCIVTGCTADYAPCDVPFVCARKRQGPLNICQFTYFSGEN